MAKFYLPTNSAEDWKQLLADPIKHWRDGYSAKSLATAWQDAHGFPLNVQKAFQAAKISAFQNLSFVAGFPEYKIQIPPITRRSSQTDLMVIARCESELAIIAVEGKVEESFGELIGEWKMHDTKGKVERLKFLAEYLGISAFPLDDVRYQLLHRTTSSLLAAKEFAARHAVMMVHSFSRRQAGFKDYSAFLKLFGLQAIQNTIQPAGNLNGIQLYFSWVVG